MNRILLSMSILLFVILTAGLIALNWSSGPIPAPQGLSIDVKEGSVKVTKGRDSIDLAAGERGVSEHGKAPVAIAQLTPVSRSDDNISSTPDTTDETVLIVRIKDIEGKAIPSVSVQARQEEKEQTCNLNEDGTATLNEVNPGPITLLVSGDHIFDTNKESVLKKGRNELEIIVSVKATFSAFVKNDKSKPVAKADVSIEPVTTIISQAQADYASRLSDAKGFFKFDPIPAATYIVNVSAVPYLPYRETVTVTPETKTQTITLSKNALVVAQVRDENGRPVDGAFVNLDSQPGSGSLVSIKQPCDRVGSATFENVLPGNYRLSAQHPWYREEGKGYTDLTVTNSRHTVDLVLTRRDYSISGTVYEAASKKVIAGITVAAHREDDVKRYQFKYAQTNEDGTYQFEDLEQGSYIVGVWNDHPDYIGHQTDLQYDDRGLPKPTRVVLDMEPEITGIDLTVYRAWSVSGRVMKKDGSPMEGVQIRCLYTYSSASGNSTTSGKYSGKQVLTDSNGNYRFQCNEYAFHERCITEILGYHDVYKETKKVTIIPKPGEEITGVDLIYENEVVVLNGSVVDESGNPLENASVYFWEDLGKNAETTTGPDGSFQVTLLPGMYSSRALKDGYLHNEPETPIEIREEVEPEPVRYVLKEGEEVFEGWVSNEESEPIAGVEVELLGGYRTAQNSSRSIQLSQTVTDENGRFRLKVVPTYKINSFSIMANSTEIYDYGFEIVYEWGKKDIHIVLKRNKTYSYGTISGFVRDDLNNPVNQFTILLISGTFGKPFVYDLFQPKSVTNVQGAFHFENVPIDRGPFVVMARTNESAPSFSEAINLGKDENRENVIITLQQSFTVTGRVVDRNGVPIQNALIDLTREIPEINQRWGDNTKLKTETAIDGTFRLPGVPLLGGRLTAFKLIQKTGSNSLDVSSSLLNEGVTVMVISDNDGTGDTEMKNPMTTVVQIAIGSPGEVRDLGNIVIKALPLETPEDENN